MKKIFLTLFVVTIFLASASSQTKFGIRGGLNLANIIMEDNDKTYSDDNVPLVSYQAGIVAERSLPGMFSLETGLLVSNKGFMVESGEDALLESKFTRTIMYLNVPVNLKIGLGFDKLRIYGAIGPYVGYALSGEDKLELTIDGDTESESADLEIGGDEEEDDILPLDYGLGIGVGVTFGPIEVGVSYEYGLANISPYQEDGFKMNTRSLSAIVTLKFGK